MIFFFSGEDPAAKETHIVRLKEKILPLGDALLFDYEVCHAGQLSAEDLKKSLAALPVYGSKRLVLIRQADKLTEPLRQLIQDFASPSKETSDVILDYSQKAPEGFVKALGKAAQVVTLTALSKKTVFDLTRVIERKNAVEALKILEELFDQGDHPLQLIGGLLWAWKRVRGKVPVETFRNGLLWLQEADISIKRSRSTPEQALEFLVVKLCS